MAMSHPLRLHNLMATCVKLGEAVGGQGTALPNGVTPRKPQRCHPEGAMATEGSGAQTFKHQERVACRR